MCCAGWPHVHERSCSQSAAEGRCYLNSVVDSLQTRQRTEDLQRSFPSQVTVERARIATTMVLLRIVVKCPTKAPTRHHKRRDHPTK